MFLTGLLSNKLYWIQINLLRDTQIELSLTQLAPSVELLFHLNRVLKLHLKLDFKAIYMKHGDGSFAIAVIA